MWRQDCAREGTEKELVYEPKEKKKGMNGCQSIKNVNGS
jgi:hypothetical protein